MRWAHWLLERDKPSLVNRKGYLKAQAFRLGYREVWSRGSNLMTISYVYAYRVAANGLFSQCHTLKEAHRLAAAWRRS